MGKKQSEIKKYSILVAEDDADLYQPLYEELTEKGYITNIATNGNECIQKINEFDPDILILDIKMPLMSGIDVLRKIKKNKNNMYVIVNSVRGLEQEIQIAKNIGASAYICKPAPFSKILSEIEKGINIISNNKKIV